MKVDRAHRRDAVVMSGRAARASPAAGATAAIVCALACAALLVVPAPAHADSRDVDGGTVSVTVQIDPRPCEAGCVPGTPPTAGLPATGPVMLESLPWIGVALLLAGALFLFCRTVRPRATGFAGASPAIARDRRGVAVVERRPDTALPAAAVPSRGRGGRS